MHPGSDFDTLQYTVLVNGAERESRTIAAIPSAFPLEIPVEELEGKDAVSIQLRALQVGAVVVERDAATNAIAGESLLLRVSLDPQCRQPAAPDCEAPTTCVAGQCVDAFVSPDRLDEFTPGWGAKGPDACKAVGQAPEVVVGAGQADYLPTKDGDVAQVEAGPQGGYHVWIAIRVRGLAQSGSVTTLAGSIGGYDVAPFAVVFTFDPSEGGACELFGLRFRIDDPAHPVDTLLGQDLRVDVSVTDTDGTVGKGSRIVRLSDDIL
jgi:hypothetical protein